LCYFLRRQRFTIIGFQSVRVVEKFLTSRTPERVGERASNMTEQRKKVIHTNARGHTGLE